MAFTAYCIKPNGGLFMNENINPEGVQPLPPSANAQTDPPRETDSGKEPVQQMTESEDMSGEGRLAVRVFTADGAIPLEGAAVIIRDTPEAGGGIVASLLTDRSGLTPVITLPAPPRELAQTPGNVKPFSSYGIDVTLAGYYTPVYESVPIFDGITSVQSVAMIPLPENGYSDSRRPDSTIIFPGSQNPGL